MGEAVTATSGGTDNVADQRVLLVGGNNEMFAHRAAMCLADDGFGIAVVSPRRLPGLRASRQVSGTSRVPLEVLQSADDRAVAALMNAVTEHDADVVFPVDLIALMACTASSAFLPVPVISAPTADVVDTCNDKGRFAELLDAIGCPQPARFQVIASLDQLGKVVIDSPMIVKPVAGDGGIGVKRVDSVSELMSHVRSGLPGTDLPLLLQEFIPGLDIDCSFYAEHGRILASAVQMRPVPSDPLIEFVADDRVVRLCELVVDALGYDGLGHADLRIDERDGSVRMIELNPRVWGSVHYSHFMGANFPGFAVRRALGQEVAPPESPVGRCRNPDLVTLTAAKGLLGRRFTAPPDLNLAEKRMFVSKHVDPVPALVLRARSSAWRVWERVKGRLSSTIQS